MVFSGLDHGPWIRTFGKDAEVVWILPKGTCQGTLGHPPASYNGLILPGRTALHPGGFYGLVWVVDRLLGPGGCPWDQAQTHATLKRYLIEEAYELIDAIDAEDLELMKEELGDVLLQPVLHAQMQCYAGGWDIDQVADGIVDKLIRRHPHVFGDVEAHTEEQVLKNWDRIKSGEKRKNSILSGVPRSAPALLRAMEISKRAARAGFEWPDSAGVFAKLEEELQEFRKAVSDGNFEEQAAELGDILFTVVNLARWSKIDAEDALRNMVDRFCGRFEQMEARSTKPLDELSAKEWDQLWCDAKKA
jgi:tetrapyrrole methylase family protein/MazG family protein